MSHFKGRTGTILLGGIAGLVLVGVVMKSARTNPTGIAAKVASTVGII